MNKKTEKEYENTKKKLMFWVAFLRISYSYKIARTYKEGKLTKESAYKLVPDLDDVLLTEENFGFVWKNPIEWLEENMYETTSAFTGASTPKVVSILDAGNCNKKEEICKEVSDFIYKSWGAKGHEPSLLVSIPLSVKKNYLYEFIKDAIEQQDIQNNDQQAKAEVPKKFELTKEIVRMDALEKAYNLIMMKAADREMPNWQLAENLGLCLKSVQTIKNGVGISLEDEDEVMAEKVAEAHKSINAVIWRYTRFAFVLAENAARGEFPKTLKEDKDEKTKRKNEFKKKYTKLKPKFLMPYLYSQSIYFQKQLTARAMVHKYANEFLVPEARINRQWRSDALIVEQYE